VAFALTTPALAVAVLHAGYAGISDEARRAHRHPHVEQVIRTHVPAADLVLAVLPRAYVVAIAAGRVHNQIGHPSYLRGAWSVTGWPSYFAVALGTKLPIALLLLAAIGAGVAIRRRAGLAAWLIGCAGFYFALFSLGVRVHIGVRHMLPVFAVAFVLGGIGARALVNARTGIALVAVLFGWLVIDAVRIYPHHAQYFNAFAGGPYEGWRTLVDSNVDWEQDRGLMRAWAAAQPRPVAIDPRAPVAGLVVVRANVLVGLNETDHRAMAWLRALTPVERLSPGVFVFDVPESAVSSPAASPADR
jgi:hypothetical protein